MIDSAIIKKKILSIACGLTNWALEKNTFQTSTEDKSSGLWPVGFQFDKRPQLQYWHISPLLTERLET